MKKYWPFLALSVLILTIMSVGAQGQYQSPALNTNVAQSAIVPYSEYYTVAPTSFPGTHIIPPEKFEPSGKLPSMVYYGSPRKEIPFSQYQTYATYTAGNTLWIQGTNSWTQSAIVPQGAFLSLIAVSPSASPAGVNGDVYEIDPEGQLKKSSYNFYQYSRMGFYADKIGQYILFYIIDGMVSNPILVQVVNYSPPPISYPYPPSYYVPAFYYYLDLFDVCPFGGQFCNGICCPPGRTCINGACLPIGQPGCPGGCPPDKVCVNGVCQPISCPDGRAKCSGQCCPRCVTRSSAGRA